jgi:hypothetical protein
MSRRLLKADGLGDLSPPLRYFVYVAGALFVFLAAAGVGATVGLLVGGGSEWVPSGPGSSGGTSETTERIVSATTAEPATSKRASVETPGDARNANSANSDETNPAEKTEAPAKETAFTHTATDANSRGDYTYIGDPAIDGDPDAVVLVVPSANRDNAKGKTYAHNIGVWYESAHKKRWAIFNQDRAAVPAGTAFEVTLPPASEGFVHYAEPANTVGERTYLDNPLTNGEPEAVLAVTQNRSPAGGRGASDDHPIGVVYDEGADEWAIRNKDGARMPDGAAFNVAVSGAGK